MYLLIRNFAGMGQHAPVRNPLIVQVLHFEIS
jgi:hypothetical protein